MTELQPIRTHTTSQPAPRRIDPFDPSLRPLREAVNRVVGSVFYGTLLQQMRASSLKGTYGHGGRGEEVFAAQLDQVLAERAGQAGRSNIGEAIVRSYARQQQRIEQARAAEREADREPLQDGGTRT